MAEKQQDSQPPQFHIGSPIRGPEGIEGRVERVVVEPESGRVVDLIVRLAGAGEERVVVLPVDCVTRADADGTHVDMSAEDLWNLPDFEEIRFRTPSVSWPGLPEYTPDVVLFWAPRLAVEAFVPPSIVPEPNLKVVYNMPEGSVAVDADLDVRCGGDVVGHVDRVLVDPAADRATHLVVRHGTLLREEHVVPVSHVRSLTDSAVELDCQAQELESFPRY